MPIKYGRTLTIIRDGETTVATELTLQNSKTVRTVITESVIVDREADILTEFLKLLDRQKTGEIRNIGIQVIGETVHGGIRMEKTWVAV